MDEKESLREYWLQFYTITIIMLIFLNIMDAITTVMAVNNPNLMEGNPLMFVLLKTPLLFIFMKVFVVTAIMYYLYLRIRKNIKKATFEHKRDNILCRVGGVGLSLSVALYIAVQWNNIFMLGV